MFARFSDPSTIILNDFRKLLPSFVAWTSSITSNHQTPETMQNTCRELARNFEMRELARNLQIPGRELARNFQEMQTTCTEPARNLPN